MAALRDIARDFAAEIRDGIGWTIVYRTGRSWNALTIWSDIWNGEWETDDLNDAIGILKADPDAVIVNGYYNGRKVIPITEADGPQKFDDELEARLVKEGVAKYIGELGETAEQPAPAPAPGDDDDEPASTNTAADEAPEYNEDMKLDELKEVAARYGVDASAMRKKADVIAAIEATKAEQPDDGTDDEDPPQIGAADPV